MSVSKDYYKTMGLNEKASPEEIRERYRSMVVGGHPDKFLDPGDKSEAEERIKQLNEAYDVLRDPARRRAYDRRLADRRRRVSSRTAEPHAPRSWTSPVTPLDLYERAPSTPSVEYLHRSLYARGGDQVRVWLSRRANVLLLDVVEYQRYARGFDYRYIGGYARISPVSLSIPYSGWWHLVVDLGGDPGQLQVAARLVPVSWW